MQMIFLLQLAEKCSATFWDASIAKRISSSGWRAKTSKKRKIPTKWRRRRGSSTKTSYPYFRPKRYHISLLLSLAVFECTGILTINITLSMEGPSPILPDRKSTHWFSQCSTRLADIPKDIADLLSLWLVWFLVAQDNFIRKNCFQQF